jgi:uncharacterized protein
VFRNVAIEEKMIDTIPCLCMYPENKKNCPTLLLYHGWSSNRQNQRFLGSILAASGFAVIAPDAPGHGQRGSIDFSSPDAVRTQFWEVVLASVAEAPVLLKGIQQWNIVDAGRIGIMGISMGSFISSAVFTEHSQLRAGVLFIGSGAWEDAARSWDPTGEFPTHSQWQLIQKLNPARRAEALDGRPLLLLHGDSDSVISVQLQREYYKAVSADPAGKNVRLVETPELGHFLELDMIETACGWLQEHLSGERVE